MSDKGLTKKAFEADERLAHDTSASRDDMAKALKRLDDMATKGGFPSELGGRLTSARDRLPHRLRS